MGIVQIDEVKRPAEPKAKENQQNSVEKGKSSSPYEESFFEQKIDIPECLRGLSTEYARKVIDNVPPEQLSQICITEFNKIQAPDISKNPLGGMHQSTVIAGMESIMPDEASPLLIRDEANKEPEFRKYLEGYKVDLVKELDKEEVQKEISEKLGKEIDFEQVKKELGDAVDQLVSSASRKSIFFGDGPTTAPLGESMSLIYFPEGSRDIMTDRFADIGAKDRVSEIKQNPKLGEYVERLFAYHESAHVDDSQYMNSGTSRDMFMMEAEADAVGSLKLLSDGIKEGNEPEARHVLRLMSDFRNSDLMGLMGTYTENGKVVDEVLKMDSADVASLSDKDLVSLGSSIADKQVPGDKALDERNKALNYIAVKLSDKSLLDEGGKLKQDPELVSALQVDGVRDIFDRAYSAYQNLGAPIPSSVDAINNYYSTVASLK